MKRDLLRLLGVEHVLDSRRLHFAEQVKDLTGGQGVDVVLNSLAGEALVRSLGVLKPHGRFLELGRRDFLMDSRLPLAPFAHNLSFFGVDLTTMVGGTSAVLDTALAALAASVHDGTYHPLPFLAYPARRIEEAFTSLQHSRHTGKIVITFEEGVQVQSPLTGPDLDSTATYLVTGGLGGFGAATARHLAARGARHLTLLGRRGTEAPEAASLLADLRNDGTDVTAYAADVTDEAELRRVLDDIDASGRRLAGVVHAAMVLDDAPLAGSSNERLRTVLGPKMTGGLLLDTLTVSDGSLCAGPPPPIPLTGRFPEPPRHHVGRDPSATRYGHHGQSAQSAGPHDQRQRLQVTQAAHQVARRGPRQDLAPHREVARPPHIRPCHDHGQGTRGEYGARPHIRGPRPRGLRPRRRRDE
ncbi:SDR family NAD(P)-dependent oxidoreductase [Streptomyces sp. NPDC006544]|uniref:SDR family NAD(P)-dependent oxidoreductase n=1 Tax=Streptomyces sp. NPDC006544 TaxID=3154583 RepID=UPI0033A3261C